MLILGQQCLLIGHIDGSIVLRSCATMTKIMVLDPSICYSKTIWSFANLGQSCFASAGDDGNIVVWNVLKAITDGQ